jgi:hypothetical protein
MIADEAENTQQEESTLCQKNYVDFKKIGDAPIICLNCELLYGLYHEEHDDIQWMCKKGVNFYPGIVPPCMKGR